MTLFLFAAVLLLALALVLLLPPLWRRPAATAGGEDVQAKVELFREQLRELEGDRDAGVLTQLQYDEARVDLERGLLASATRSPRSHQRSARGMAVAVAVLVPALALGLYLQLGAWQSQRQAAAVPTDPAAQLAFIRENIGQLEEVVEEDPRALEPRLMLARSYILLERLDQALAVYADGLERVGDAPPLLADYAEALVQKEGGRFTPQGRDLLARALAQDAAQPKALWLAGLASAQAGDRSQATKYWERLLSAVPPESQTAAQLRTLLTEIQAVEEPAAAGGAKVSVALGLAPELAERVPSDATVFVLARAPDGDGPPLAVQRLTVADLPRQVVLDESMAMVPEMNLGRFPNVVLEARVSFSGQAKPQSGDLLGRTAPVAVGAEPPVELRIDKVVP
jgi:cytochrome c-type biogenesis protein CcmH